LVLEEFIPVKRHEESIKSDEAESTPFTLTPLQSDTPLQAGQVSGTPDQ
jgi:hypothetical protein